MNTPWGQSQNTTKIANGIYHVSTASHGGYLVAKSVVPACGITQKLRGADFGNFLAYEEDCAWTLLVTALCTLPELNPTRLAFFESMSHVSELEVQEDTIRTLKSYYPEVAAYYL